MSLIWFERGSLSAFRLELSYLNNDQIGIMAKPKISTYHPMIDHRKEIAVDLEDGRKPEWSKK